VDRVRLQSAQSPQEVRIKPMVVNRRQRYYCRSARWTGESVQVKKTVRIMSGITPRAGRPNIVVERQTGYDSRIAPTCRAHPFHYTALASPVRFSDDQPLHHLLLRLRGQVPGVQRRHGIDFSIGFLMRKKQVSKCNIVHVPCN
jgi:hypothetical protein